MHHDGEVVGIVAGIKLGDVEQALSAQAITKVTRVEGRISLQGQGSCDAVLIGAVSILGLGAHSHRQDGEDEEEQQGAAPTPRRHGG